MRKSAPRTPMVRPARRRAARASMVAHGADAVRPRARSPTTSWTPGDRSRARACRDDGQWLAYALTAQGEDGELVVRNLAQRPGVQAARAARRPSFTPDGKFIVFTIAQTKADEEREAAAEPGPVEPERPRPEGAGQGTGRGGAGGTHAAHRPRHHDAAVGPGHDDRENRQLPSAGRVVGLARLLQGRRRNRRRRARRRRRTWRPRRRRTSGRSGGAAGAGGRRARSGKPGARQRAAREAQGPRLGSHPPQPRDRRRGHHPRRHRVRLGTRRARGSPTRSRRPDAAKDGAFARRIERRHRQDAALRTRPLQEPHVRRRRARSSPSSATRRSTRRTVSPYRLYYWKAADAAAAEVASAATAGMPKGMVVSESPRRDSRGTARASILAPAPPPAAPRRSGRPARRRRSRSISGATKDPLIQPMQRCAPSRSASAATARSFTWPTRSFVQLATADLPDRERRPTTPRARSAPRTCRIGRRSRGTRPTTTCTCSISRPASRRRFSSTGATPARRCRPAASTCCTSTRRPATGSRYRVARRRRA